VKRLTDHSTNKAFDRYLEVQVEEKRQGIELVRMKRRTSGNVAKIRKPKQ
jgi:hypothetical protein